MIGVISNWPIWKSGSPAVTASHVLVATGRRANLDGLEEFVPDLAVRRIPDANHWVVHQKPDLVNSYIREFISA